MKNEANMKEEWVKWEPIKGLSEKYYTKSILDGFEGFKIVLCDENNDRKKAIITFDAVSSYKWTDETFRLNTVAFLDKKYEKGFYIKWTFFKVISSSYIHLLSKESGGIADFYSLNYFVILESNAIIDIIASQEPQIELFDEVLAKK
jgi:hypothetical protein